MWKNRFYGFLINAVGEMKIIIGHFLEIPHLPMFPAPQVMGQAIITKVPPPSISGNTEELRRLWVGCKINGSLMAPGVFHARSWDVCMRALLDKHGEGAKEYIEFWKEYRKKQSNDLTFEFEDCFEFRRKDYYNWRGTFRF